MKRSLASFAACLLAAAPAAAEGSGLQDLSSPGSTTFGTSGPLRKFGWGGLGFYNAASTSFFGFNAGGAFDLAVVAPDLPLAVIANVGFAFSSDVILPITVGAAVHYDRLPVTLLGGLGFTLVPHTGGGGTPLGIGILGMATYPLPQVRPGVAAMAQLQYHILDDGFSLFVLDVGATVDF